MPGTSSRTTLGPNCVDTEQIFDGAVTAAKLDPSIVGVLPLIVTTAQRKALTPTTGQQVYDTTLKQPVWYNGTAWTDATGTSLVGG
jgi:hypothetical protein